MIESVPFFPFANPCRHLADCITLKTPSHFSRRCHSIMIPIKRSCIRTPVRLLSTRETPPRYLPICCPLVTVTSPSATETGSIADKLATNSQTHFSSWLHGAGAPLSTADCRPRPGAAEGGEEAGAVPPRDRSFERGREEGTRGGTFGAVGWKQRSRLPMCRQQGWSSWWCYWCRW